MIQRTKIWIFFISIMVVTILAGLIDWPKGPNLKIGKYFREIKVHQGLDLQGGVHLVYQLDTSKISEADRGQAETSVVDIIRRRVDFLGVAEPVITPSKVGGQDAVIVELPGISDVEYAKNTIGKTAQLTFWEIDETGQQKQTELTGAHLKKAEVTFEQSGNPQISLTFDSEGAKLFKDITSRNLQKPVAIELDGEIISAPTVQSVINDGQAVITGKFTIQEAKDLAKLLNAGALPVPVSLVEERNIEATLGTEAVQKSFIAGLIGLLLVIIYMISYYRFQGLLASIALIIYSLVALALFKLIPVTLTLAGIAGFILSIGMAVDANILIFERTIEEKRQRKITSEAIKQGFARAWPSIRDSNFSSLITCAILFWMGSGLVRGFALTLAIGILVSMFTAITVTRNFIFLTYKES